MRGQKIRVIRGRLNPCNPFNRGSFLIRIIREIRGSLNPCNPFNRGNLLIREIREIRGSFNPCNRGRKVIRGLSNSSNSW